MVRGGARKATWMRDIAGDGQFGHHGDVGFV